MLKIVKAVATLYLQRESEAGEFLADPSRLENFWRMRLGALTNEVFEVAYLDTTARRSASCASCLNMPNSTALDNHLMFLR